MRCINKQTLYAPTQGTYKLVDNRNLYRGLQAFILNNFSLHPLTNQLYRLHNILELTKVTLEKRSGTGMNGSLESVVEELEVAAPQSTWVIPKLRCVVSHFKISNVPVNSIEGKLRVCSIRYNHEVSGNATLQKCETQTRSKDSGLCLI